MPFWSDVTWLELPADKIPVEPFDPERLEEAKYIMAIGDEVYVSSSKAGNTITSLKGDEAFQLGPGQFAYILTKETVCIPFDAIGFISINATIKFNGLVNISGFHVDPGYHGKLLFSVFNAGPITIHLRRGQPIFPLWIASLDAPTRKTVPKLGHPRIDPNLITTISGNYTTAFELDQIIRTLRNEFDNAKTDIGSLKATRTHLAVVIIIGTFLLGSIATAGLKFTVDWIRYGNPWFDPVHAAVLPPVTAPTHVEPTMRPAPPSSVPDPSVQPAPLPPPGTDKPHG